MLHSPSPLPMPSSHKAEPISGGSSSQSSQVTGVSPTLAMDTLVGGSTSPKTLDVAAETQHVRRRIAAKIAIDDRSISLARSRVQDVTDPDDDITIAVVREPLPAVPPGDTEPWWAFATVRPYFWLFEVAWTLFWWWQMRLGDKQGVRWKDQTTAFRIAHYLYMSSRASTLSIILYYILRRSFMALRLPDLPRLYAPRGHQWLLHRVLAMFGGDLIRTVTLWARCVQHLASHVPNLFLADIAILLRFVGDFWAIRSARQLAPSELAAAIAAP